MEGLAGRAGKWKSVHKRHTGRARVDIWKGVFQASPDDPDNRDVMIDSTMVRTRRQAVCGKGGSR